MDKLPFRDFAMNAVWLELSLIAQDLHRLDQGARASTASSPSASPRRLRYRLLHIAGRLAFHARRATLRLKRLALGQRARRRLRAPAGAPATGRLTDRPPRTDHHARQRSSAQRALSRKRPPADSPSGLNR